jgi:cell migration-inducing and hyaluronan-binding protein
LLLGGVFGVAHAQDAGSPVANRWSDPATWPNRKVPVAGDKVIIARDKDVVLDVSPPALGGLSIDGKLTFSNDADLELTTEWIMLHGELAIGSEAAPHTRKATITFTDNVKGEDVMAGMGDRGIMISGGSLNLDGDQTNAWTKLPPRLKQVAPRYRSYRFGRAHARCCRKIIRSHSASNTVSRRAAD